ncbi:FtsX-like permease family protein [Actinacidiphila acidipaludis]|uniref:ABC transporter permease n=1 Tax=Actinacidiphila acidipaludis TaxID=2873382 RepID=A0ABS7QID2_9ACTN|nr:FtsX-like permease family protein [Streptomyces acidipaludis]MBY8882928.1 ABC transporter permease [Streptomyces acidipaludis]
MADEQRPDGQRPHEQKPDGQKPAHGTEGAGIPIPAQARARRPADEAAGDSAHVNGADGTDPGGSADGGGNAGTEGNGTRGNDAEDNGAEGGAAEGNATGQGRGSGLAWVRVRLRAAPAAAVATCLLVLVTALLAAALPRAVDRYENTALRRSVLSAQVRDRGVSLADSYTPGGTEAGDIGPSMDRMDTVEQEFQALVSPPIRLLRDQTVIGMRSSAEADVTDPEVPRTSSHDPAASLVSQRDLPSHLRILSGRLPRPVQSAGATSIEGVVTQKMAQVLHLRIGQVVHLSSTSPTTVAVRIVGIGVPRDPKAAYWNEDGDLLAPHLTTPLTPPGDEPKTYWHFTVLVDFTATGTIPRLGLSVNLYWHHPMDTAVLAAHDIPAEQQELSSFDSGPLSVALQTDTQSNVRVETTVGALFDEFTTDRKAAAPLVLIAAIGVGTTAAAVLLMAGGLAAERRRAEIALLRSRGGSLRGIGRRLAGETAAAALPGGIAGTLLALVLLPTERWVLPVLLGAVVTLVALLALPMRAAWAVRRPRPAAREDVTALKPSRRRLVAELTVAVLVVGAVVALRQRGTDHGDDPFLAAAPVLVAIAAALILLRVYPLPLRLLARPTGRLRGAVAHLGLARAGRTPASNQLPLLAMLVSLTVASFGGSVLAGIDHGRDRAATATVGADARIDAQNDLAALARQLPDQVRKVPGVGHVVTARVENNSPNTLFPLPWSLVVVTPDDYGKLTREIGLPSFPASVYRGWHGSGPLPAVLSPKLATALGAKTTQINTGVGAIDIRRAATLTTTPAAPGDNFIIVSSDQLGATHPEMAAYRQYLGPTALLAMAAPGRQIDTAALHKVAEHSTTLVSVLTRAEQRAAMSDTALQHGARIIYLWAVAAGAAYSALALLLSLLQAAPQRSTLLARLRTMGMTRRQSRRLVLLEMLPQALLAAVGGVLVGLAVIPLLGPGVDLRALTFGTGPRSLAPVDFGLGLHADPWSLALPSVGLVVLACVVLIAQVWVSGRRRESQELRAGDRT